MLFEDKIAGKCGQTNMVNLNTSIVIFSGVSNLEILIKRIQIVSISNERHYIKAAYSNMIVFGSFNTNKS